MEKDIADYTKDAYEMLKANNRIYTFADEKTRNQIAYISNYYLEHTMETRKAAWQKGCLFCSNNC